MPTTGGCAASGADAPCGATACQSVVMSSTVRVKKPIVSKVGTSAKQPSVEIAPQDGLKPTTPQNEAGRHTDPTVCVPIAARTMPVATAAAEPIDEPPGVCSEFHGLRVGPGSR